MGREDGIELGGIVLELGAGIFEILDGELIGAVSRRERNVVVIVGHSARQCAAGIMENARRGGVAARVEMDRRSIVGRV